MFCHGIWADGSCFNKVIPTLQADGYEVMAAQYEAEDSMNADVLTARVADGIAVITLGSARRIYFDEEMGDALTEALDGFAGWHKTHAPPRSSSSDPREVRKALAAA